MKISTAIKNAWKAYTASPLRTLKFLLIEACLTLICLAPLLFLTNGSLAWAALACPVLWLLGMLPARMNAALSMREGLHGGSLAGSELIETRDYGTKLLCGLKRLGFLLLWSIPLIVLAIEVKIHFSGNVDSFTVLRMIRNDLGGGDQMRGIRVVVWMVVGALLVLLVGCAFHSGARHAFAQGNRKVVQGHHGKIMLTWLCSLLSILPILIAIVWVIFRYLPVVRNLNGLLMGTVSLPATRGTLIILLVGAVLTLPLLPLRSLIHAAYVDGLRKAE